MNKQKWTKGISLFLSAALVFSGCGAETENTSQDDTSAIAVKAVTAEVGTLSVSNQFIGTVSPKQQVSIIPLVSGEVDAIYAEVGDEVSAGDVLFHIKDEAAKLQKESAELTKQGAELSAQMQLGSGQVMNNISMQTNIRSLEYQLELAKDQYNTAVNGVSDAEDAKDDLNKAIGEINGSVSSLQESNQEMQNTIEEAQQYITLTGEWETAYSWSLKPDEYDWSQTGGESSGEIVPDDALSGIQDTIESLLPNDTYATGEANPGDMKAADLSEQAGSMSVPEEEVSSDVNQTSFLPAENEENSVLTGQTAGSGTLDTNSGEAENAEHATASGSEATAASDAGTQSGGEMQPAEVENQEELKTGSENQSGGETAYRDSTENGYAYFSVEIISEAPVYLAEGKPAPPDDQFESEEEAWAAYYEQQKIDELKQKTEAMGFSTEDIKTGKAYAAVLENSANIVALQYQASQLQSSQATVESSIKSAETAKGTTAKTIDFYEDSLKNAQATYGLSNGQAYEDTAAALETQIQAAEVGVKSAEMQLEYYSPTTPISGTVVAKNVEQYGMVQPGYAAYVISNQDAMNVTFAVSGQVRESLQIGMPVTLEKDGNTYPGTITEISQTVDPQSGGLFSVKAITEADGDKLVSGTAVKLTVDTFRSENAVLIPYDAVHFESEQAYVFVIEDNKAVKTPITIGLMNDDTVEVTDGLADGSRVVATWSSQLEDGALVRIVGESQNSNAGEAEG